VMAAIEGGVHPLETKLLAAHSNAALSVLEKIANQPRRASDLDPEYRTSACFHETNDQNKGYFKIAPTEPATWDTVVLCGPNLLTTIPPSTGRPFPMISSPTPSTGSPRRGRRVCGNSARKAKKLRTSFGSHAADLSDQIANGQ